MDYLSERIKKARLMHQQETHLALSRQCQRPFPQQSPQIASIVPEKRQQMQVFPLQRVQQMSTGPTEPQQMVANNILAGPRQMQQPRMPMSPQQRQEHQDLESSPDILEEQLVEEDLLDRRENSRNLHNRSYGSQTDDEESSKETYAYLEKIIENPRTALRGSNSSSDNIRTRHHIPDTPDSPDSPNVRHIPYTPDSPDSPNVRHIPYTPDSPDAHDRSINPGISCHRTCIHRIRDIYDILNGLDSGDGLDNRVIPDSPASPDIRVIPARYAVIRDALRYNPFITHINDPLRLRDIPDSPESPESPDNCYSYSFK